MQSEPENFQPIEMLRILAKNDVAYVLIGGLAAVLHGSPTFTNDADVCPSRNVENLHRLARALREMGARIRIPSEPNGLQFACDAEMIAHVKMLNMQTDFGWLDVSIEPGGFELGYEQLRPHALIYPVEDFEVPVAALRDIIASKETANRAKDKAALPYLYALEDELAAQERGEER